jgi:N-acetylneuraminate synthase
MKYYTILKYNKTYYTIFCAFNVDTNLDFDYGKLADKKHTFVIAEAGSNWKCGTLEEDLGQAKKLIKIAANAKADAVKFQTFKSNSLYAPNAGKSDYLSKNGIDQTVNDMFNYLTMPHQMIPELAKTCKQENILFMSTPFSVVDAQEIEPYVDLHKVASYEINHVRLVEYVAKTGKPILVSTGASTFAEIDFAVNLIKQNNNSKMALLQCTSKYPAPVESLNLSVIPTIKSRYGVPVGLSDHSIDPLLAPLLAIGYGATIIEKHFTIDKNLPGPDHKFALNPPELELMIKSIRSADLAKGTGIKEILEDERELKQFATRSLQAIKKISKGELLKEGVNFDVLRPGKQLRGLEARLLSQVDGKRATKNIEIGEGITDYE